MPFLKHITSSHIFRPRSYFLPKLHVAALFADWNAVAALLDIGCDPLAINKQGFTIPIYATYTGQHDTIRNWGLRFPNYDWRTSTHGLGMTALAIALQVGPNKRLTIEALVEAGVDVADQKYWMNTGSHPLIQCAANMDTEADVVRFLLTLPGIRQLVNQPMLPRTRSWKIKYLFARLLVKMGSKKALLKAVSSWPGQTPLGSAARQVG